MWWLCLVGRQRSQVLNVNQTNKARQRAATYRDRECPIRYYRGWGTSAVQDHEEQYLKMRWEASLSLQDLCVTSLQGPVLILVRGSGPLWSCAATARTSSFPRGSAARE